MDVCKEEDEHSCNTSVKYKDELTFHAIGDSILGTELASYMVGQGDQ